MTDAQVDDIFKLIDRDGDKETLFKEGNHF